MWIKLIVLISISSIIISFGIIWYRKSFSSEDHYDFKEDFKRSFLSLHWKYSGFFNDAKPRRIVPSIIILGGVGILIVGLNKILMGG